MSQVQGNLLKERRPSPHQLPMSCMCRHACCHLIHTRWALNRGGCEDSWCKTLIPAAFKYLTPMKCSFIQADQLCLADTASTCLLSKLYIVFFQDKNTRSYLRSYTLSSLGKIKCKLSWQQVLFTLALVLGRMVPKTRRSIKLSNFGSI